MKTDGFIADGVSSRRADRALRWCENNFRTIVSHCAIVCAVAGLTVPVSAPGLSAPVAAHGCGVVIDETHGTPQLLAPRAAVFLETARTPEQRRRGLMDRRSLPAHHGMIFLFPQDGTERFWMKDTYVPLDMVFASSDGIITSIVRNAAPGAGLTDERQPVYSGQGCAVIELPAGEAASDGLLVGNRLRFRGGP